MSLLRLLLGLTLPLSVVADCSPFYTSGFDLFDFDNYGNFFDDNSVLTLPMVGSYTGLADILEYMLFATPAGPFVESFKIHNMSMEQSGTISADGACLFLVFMKGSWTWREMRTTGVTSTATLMVKLTYNITSTKVADLTLYDPNTFLDQAFKSWNTIEGRDFICDILYQTCPSVWTASGFQNHQECLDFHATLSLFDYGPDADETQGGGAQGYSLACRMVHSALAQSNEKHCPHISKVPMADDLGRVKCQADSSQNLKNSDFLSVEDREMWRTKSEEFGVDPDVESILTPYTPSDPAGCTPFYTSGFDLFDFDNYGNFFDDNSVLTLPMVGSYSGLNDITEYMLFATPKGPFVEDFQIHNMTMELTNGKTSHGECRFNVFMKGSWTWNKNRTTGITSTAVLMVKLTYNITSNKVGDLTLYDPIAFLDQAFKSWNTLAAREFICDILHQTCPDSWSASGFQNNQECLDYHADLSLFDYGADADITQGGGAQGHSLACRMVHSGLARSNNAHCPHISKAPMADELGRIKCQANSNSGWKYSGFFSDADMAMWRTKSELYGVDPDVGSIATGGGDDPIDDPDHDVDRAVGAVGIGSAAIALFMMALMR